MFNPSKGGTDLAGMFLNNRATQATPMQEITAPPPPSFSGMGGPPVSRDMGGMPPVSRQPPMPPPVMGSMAPGPALSVPPPPPAPPPVPAGFQSAAGQSALSIGGGPQRARHDQLWGSGHADTGQLAPVHRAARDNGGRLPQGVFQSTSNPMQYLLPGRPGHPGFTPGGTPPVSPPQPSQAQLMARQINEAALKRRMESR